MRPDWMKCETCLFFQQSGEECWKSPRTYIVGREAFCADWTCRRCLQPWRFLEIEYMSEKRQNGYEFFSFNNHSTCLEATIA